MNKTRTKPTPRLTVVGRLLERGVELDIILETMVDEVVAALDADRGTLYLVDPHRGQIFSKAAHLPELAEIRLEMGQGAAGWVAERGEPLTLTGPYKDERFDRSIDERTGYETSSLVAVPVRDRRGEVIGVLQVLNKRKGKFNQDDTEQLGLLAEQAGEVIEKTSLYAQLKAEGRDDRRLVDYRYNFIVGTSTAMRQVYALVDRAAATDATVLLQGESGTGKGLLARAIHRNSARQDAPFITLDCTALPPSLIENELFGHERGAYTGADSKAPGKFELADGGTVFIDEIGELPGELQGKLLRLIQDRAFERVGGTETLRVDVRVIAATNRDLDRMVDEGTFRSELYYRIRVLPILLPTLSERGPEDIQRLGEHFVGVFANKHGRLARTFSRAAVQRLLQHGWPGNIRELENCVESAVILADGESIEPDHLSLPPRRGRGNTEPVDLGRTLAEVEHDYIRAVLEDAGGNQSEAARRLGISRNTLSRKLKDAG